MCPRQPFWMNAVLGFIGAMFIVCALLFREPEMSVGLRVALVGLTVVPMAVWVLGFRQWLTTIDELERLIQLQAMGVALGSSVLLVLGYGLMAQAQLLMNSAEGRLWGYLWAWMLGSWSLSQAVIRRRYQ